MTETVRIRQVVGRQFTNQQLVSCAACEWETVTITQLAYQVACDHKATPEHRAAVTP